MTCSSPSGVASSGVRVVVTATFGSGPAIPLPLNPLHFMYLSQSDYSAAPASAGLSNVTGTSAAAPTALVLCGACYRSPRASVSSTSASRSASPSAFVAVSASSSALPVV